MEKEAKTRYFLAASFTFIFWLILWLLGALFYKSAFYKQATPIAKRAPLLMHLKKSARAEQKPPSVSTAQNNIKEKTALVSEQVTSPASPQQEILIESPIQELEIVPAQSIKTEVNQNTEAELRRLFLDALQYELSEKLHYPRLARRRGHEGLVRYSLAISGNGELESIVLLESSGSSILDRDAANLIRAAFPRNYQGEEDFKTDFSIRYTLKD